jgi:hypothetical protein
VSREDIRAGVAAYFGGATVDARGFYRPSPLAGLGLSGVRAYYNDRIDDNRDYTEGLDAGATFGAVMCVHLAAMNETRLTIGGTLNRPYNVELYVWYQATRPPPEDAQAAFDGLLDAIVDRVRADPTLGMGVDSAAPTIVTQAGEGERGISITSAVPYTEPGSATKGSAVVSFDVSTYPNIA